MADSRLETCFQNIATAIKNATMDSSTVLTPDGSTGTKFDVQIHDVLGTDAELENITPGTADTDVQIVATATSTSKGLRIARGKKISGISVPTGKALDIKTNGTLIAKVADDAIKDVDGNIVIGAGGTVPSAAYTNITTGATGIDFISTAGFAKTETKLNGLTIPSGVTFASVSNGTPIGGPTTLTSFSNYKTIATELNNGTIQILNNQGGGIITTLNNGNGTGANGTITGLTNNSGSTIGTLANGGTITTFNNSNGTVSVITNQPSASASTSTITALNNGVSTTSGYSSVITTLSNLKSGSIYTLHNNGEITTLDGTGSITYLQGTQTIDYLGGAYSGNLIINHIDGAEANTLLVKSCSAGSITLGNSTSSTLSSVINNGAINSFVNSPYGEIRNYWTGGSSYQASLSTKKQTGASYTNCAGYIENTAGTNSAYGGWIKNFTNGAYAKIDTITNNGSIDTLTVGNTGVIGSSSYTGDNRGTMYINHLGHNNNEGSVYVKAYDNNSSSYKEIAAVNGGAFMAADFTTSNTGSSTTTTITPSMDAQYIKCATGGVIIDNQEIYKVNAVTSLTIPSGKTMASLTNNGTIDELKNNNGATITTLDNIGTIGTLTNSGTMTIKNSGSGNVSCKNSSGTSLGYFVYNGKTSGVILQSTYTTTSTTSTTDLVIGLKVGTANTTYYSWIQKYADSSIDKSSGWITATTTTTEVATLGEQSTGGSATGQLAVFMTNTSTSAVTLTLYSRRSSTSSWGTAITSYSLDSKSSYIIVINKSSTAAAPVTISKVNGTLI